MSDIDAQFPNGISTSAETVPSLGEAALLWRAKRLAPSAYLDHLSFLFWLVIDLQPRRLVALDVTDGIGYFAACQAIRRQGLETLCRGFRFGAGKETDEARQAREALESYNAENYQAFSVVETLLEERAADNVSAASVDLLMLERFPTADMATALEDVWLSRLSSHGVLLVPGSHRVEADEASRDWLEELRSRHQSISFSHGQGLTAVMIGDKQPARLTHLAELAATPSSGRQIQDFFDRISQLHVLEVAHDEAELASRSNRNWAMRLKAEKKTLSDAYEARHETAARLQAELFDRVSEVAEARNRRQIDGLVSRQICTDLSEKIAALEAALEGQRTQTRSMRDRLEALQKDYADTVRYYRDEVEALQTVNAAQARKLAMLGAGAGSCRADNLDGRLHARFAEIAALTAALESQLGEA